MAHEAFLSAIGKLEVSAETTFGDEGSNYKYVRTMPIDRSGLTATSMRNESQRQQDVELAKIVGPHGGTLQTSVYLHGFSSTVPSTPPAHTSSTAGGATGFDLILDILAGGIGNLHSGGYVTNETASTTSILKADSQDLTIGQLVAWQDSNDEWHVNSITNIDAAANPDEMPLLQTALAVPANNKIFGAHTIFQCTGTPFFDGAVKAFSLRYTGMGADDRTIMTGCTPSGISISLPVGELPVLNVDWNISHWSEDALTEDLGVHGGLEEGGGEGLTGGLTSSEAWSFPTCEAVTQAHVSWGTTQANERQVQGIEVNIGLEVQPIVDPHSNSGVGGWYVTKRTPSITLTMMRDVQEEIQDFFEQSGKTLTVWGGSQAGRLYAFQMPNARISEYSSQADNNGAVMTTLTFLANEFTGDTGVITSNTVPGDKQFRMGFL